MNSEEAEIRIDLHVKIDVLLECLDAPDECGIVWCDTDPYEVVLPTAETLPDEEDKEAWYLTIALIAVTLGIFAGLAVLVVLAASIYAAMGVLLWLLVSSIT